MPSIHARVAEGWRRSRMIRGIRKKAKTYPAMFSPRKTFFQTSPIRSPTTLQVSGGHSCRGDIPFSPGKKGRSVLPLREGVSSAYYGPPSA